MIDAESKRIAKRRISELRKNPPKVTQADIDGADRLLKKHEEFEAAKDRDIDRERQALAKDVAGYVHTHVNGVGKMFHGVGEGKARSIVCCLCGAHEGEMFNMNDGNWYCRSHKSIGNLSEEQKEKELSCLKT